MTGKRVTVYSSDVAWSQQVSFSYISQFDAPLGKHFRALQRVWI